MNTDNKRVKPNIRDREKAELNGVSVLINSYMYLLDHVLIVSYGIYYRLLVIHKWRLLTDKIYQTIQEAKIAFTRTYGQRTRYWRLPLHAEWSEFYYPGKNYLDMITGEIKQ